MLLRAFHSEILEIIKLAKLSKNSKVWHKEAMFGPVKSCS